MTPHVTKEQAIALKKIGFDWKVNAAYVPESEVIRSGDILSNWNWYNNHYYSAPTIDEAVRWLREVKGLHCYAKPIWNGSLHWQGVIIYLPTFRRMDTGLHLTHDEVILSCITKALEMCEKEGEGE